MKTFDTSEYRFSHGREPRGQGCWIFAPADAPNDQSRWVEPSTMEPRGPLTYTDAKKRVPAGDWKVLP